MRRPLPSHTTVEAATRGERAAIELLLDACLPIVLQWCRRLGGAGIDPEDVAHDILVIVLDRLGALENPVTFPAWLFQITRKTMASRRRQAWLRRWVPGVGEVMADGGCRPDRYQELAEDLQRIQDLLDRLPEAQRQVLVLHDLEERSDSEVADILGIPKGTVKSRLNTARRRFKVLAIDSGVWPRARALVALEVGR